MGLRERADRQPIRVLVVEGDERVRGALRILFETQSDLQVVGEAASADEALAGVARLDPDVVLMDCRTAATLDGAAAIRPTARSTGGPRIVLLLNTGPDDESPAWDADAVVVKGCTSEFLLKSLRRVRRTRPENDRRAAPDPTPRREP